MKLSLRTIGNIAKLTIQDGTCTLQTDIAEPYENRRWAIDENLIQQFITVANDMSRFNNVKDLDFVKGIIGAFLNDSELELLKEYLNDPKPF